MSIAPKFSWTQTQQCIKINGLGSLHDRFTSSNLDECVEVKGWFFRLSQNVSIFSADLNLTGSELHNVFEFI